MNMFQNKRSYRFELNIFCKLIPVGSIIKVKEVHEACYYIHETICKQYLKIELLTCRKYIVSGTDICKYRVGKDGHLFREPQEKDG